MLRRMNYKEIPELDRYSNSLDALSPYIGKMRPELVDWVIENFSCKNGTIYDPFSGSGTVLLEGWKYGYSVIGTDLNDYAIVLSKGKTHPFISEKDALDRIDCYEMSVKTWMKRHDNTRIPEWVSDFFNPDTLKEICAWTSILKKNQEWFLLSCLLGILHHQRPGFLSYPSSHGAPYLRTNKYPLSEYPEMYQYREVLPRLVAKVGRVYRNMPGLNFDISRNVLKKDASKAKFEEQSINTIITSPPYMKSLTYARDNRLRLFFLGEEDWRGLDKLISPERKCFFSMITECFKKWYKIQPPNGRCVLVVGDIKAKYEYTDCRLPEALELLSDKYYRLVDSYLDPIPETRKVVKGNSRVTKEAVLVFERR